MIIISKKRQELKMKVHKNNNYLREEHQKCKGEQERMRELQKSEGEQVPERGEHQKCEGEQERM